MKTLIVLVSYHHLNTQKVADVFSKVLDAQIKTPQQVSPEELRQFDLVGFGSGIYSDKNDQSLLDLVDQLPKATHKKAFLFSTSGMPIGMSGQTD